MIDERRAAALAILLLTGCPNESAAPKPTGSATVAAPSSGSAATGATTTTVTAQPTTSATPPIPRSGVATFDHFALATPPAANACPPLPKGGGEPSRSIAAALRRLSCEPALFYRPVEALRRELALAADHELAFNGPSSVTLSFSSGTNVLASDLANALGEPSAKAARSKTGAWGFRNWYLTASADGAILGRWSPGRIYVGVAVEDPGMEVDVTPLGKSMTRGDATVSMPPEILPLKDDATAAAHLVAALERVAADKAQLDAEPADVAKRIGIDDERFRVSRRAIGTGPSSVKGIDVWMARTRIAAAPVIEKLGLKGNIEHLRATDTNDVVLYDGGDHEHAWRGTKVSLRFAPRDGSASSGAAADFVLTGVTVMP